MAELDGVGATAISVDPHPGLLAFSHACWAARDGRRRSYEPILLHWRSCNRRITRQEMVPAYRPVHTGRLVLTPRDPNAPVDPERLEAALRAEGLIASSIADDTHAFEIGERFLELIAYTGCAVQLDTDASRGGKSMTHIRLHGPYVAPCLLSGRNTRPPRCPECGKGLAAWREQLPLQRSGSPQRWSRELHCGQCGTSAPNWRWDWGRHGGVGRCFVFVEEVFPGEAAPLPGFFDALRPVGAGEWRYFYLQDEAAGMVNAT